LDVSITGLIVKMTELIVRGMDRVKDKGDFEDAQAQVEFFLHANIHKLLDWAKKFPGQRPPVYYLDGKVVWLTRSQRRKMASRRARAARARA
jgi:hypothetical protein